ncbi:MAG: XapX domain-containing protein [Nitrospiria bacterium]
MTDIIKALVLGGVVGSIFGFFKVEIPAPPTLAGVAGILGLFLGYILVK